MKFEIEDVKQINVPDGVTHIDEEVFAEYYNIESVIMPDSLVLIDNYT